MTEGVDGGGEGRGCEGRSRGSLREKLREDFEGGKMMR